MRLRLLLAGADYTHSVEADLFSCVLNPFDRSGTHRGRTCENTIDGGHADTGRLRKISNCWSVHERPFVSLCQDIYDRNDITISFPGSIIAPSMVEINPENEISP